MSIGYDRFSQGARRVLARSEVEARRLGHVNIDTEHILLALVFEESRVISRIFNNLGVSPNKIQAGLESVIGIESHSTSGEIDLAPGGKGAIELAVDEARRLNSNYVGTEHLLLGLLREGEGVAYSVLESLGIALEQAGNQVNRAKEDEDIEMVIDNLGVLKNNQRVLVLKEKKRERYLSIWIGPSEADAIAVKLQNIQLTRPLTHDLLCDVIAWYGGSVARVVISELRDDMFYAKLELGDEDKCYEIDCRPSDAIAVAVRIGAPIYVVKSVIERAGVLLEEKK